MKADHCCCFWCSGKTSVKDDLVSDDREAMLADAWPLQSGKMKRSRAEKSDTESQKEFWGTPELFNKLPDKTLTGARRMGIPMQAIRFDSVAVGQQASEKVADANRPS